MKGGPIPFIMLCFYQAIHGLEILPDKLKLIISQLTEKSWLKQGITKGDMRILFKIVCFTHSWHLGNLPSRREV